MAIANDENAGLRPNLSATYPNDMSPMIPPIWFTIIHKADLAYGNILFL